MYKRRFIIILLTFVNCAYLKAQTNVLYAKDLNPYGRAEITNNLTLELISSGVHFGFSFHGRTCAIYATLPSWLNHNYLQYELDGVYQRRIKVSKNNQPITITASKDGKHKVWIYKATEATTGSIFIQKVEGKDLQSLQSFSAPLIEFIGNSITCGAESDTSEMPCGVGDYHD